MRVKLTTEFCRTLPKADLDIYDTKYPGLVLRCRKSGVHTYRVLYGRGQSVTLGRADVLTPDAARVKARAELVKIDQGHDPKTARRAKGDLALRAFVTEHYTPWMLAERPRTKQLKRLAVVCAVLGSQTLRQITAFGVEKWRRDRLKDGITAATCNRDVAALTSALSRAVKWGFLKANPLIDVSPLTEDDSRAVRCLTAPEEQRLRDALKARDDKRRADRERANVWRSRRGYQTWPAYGVYTDHLTPLVLLALNSGLRRGELLNLRWQDLDLVRAVLTVHGAGAKSGQTRHVPLNSEALDVLRAWHRAAAPATPEAVVFAGRTEGTALQEVKTAWGRALRAAKIQRFRFHDLRHSFASRLVLANVDLGTVRELLGHREIETTLRYSHSAPAHKVAAVATLVTGR